MPAFAMNNQPVHFRWPVNRGTTNADYETWPIWFAMPGGYTITRLGDGAEEVTITDPIDVTNRTFGGSVTVERGGEVLCPVTLLDDDPADGAAALAIARSDLVDLPTGIYKFDLIQDLGLASESTIILGTLVVTGRATP